MLRRAFTHHSISSAHNIWGLKQLTLLILFGRRGRTGLLHFAVLFDFGRLFPFYLYQEEKQMPRNDRGSQSRQFASRKGSN